MPISAILYMVACGSISVTFYILSLPGVLARLCADLLILFNNYNVTSPPAAMFYTLFCLYLSIVFCFPSLPLVLTRIPKRWCCDNSQQLQHGISPVAKLYMLFCLFLFVHCAVSSPFLLSSLASHSDVVMKVNYCNMASLPWPLFIRYYVSVRSVPFPFFYLQHRHKELVSQQL